MSADETADLDALQLVCPITAELFEDPVLLVEDGYTYERSAVTAWLEKHDTSPMSGATLTTRTLAPNIRARQQADAARGGKPPPEAKRNNEVTRLGKQASVKNDERSRSATIPGRRRLSPVHLHGSNARSTDTTDTSSNVNTTTTTGVRWSDALLRWVRSYSVSNGGPRAAQRPAYDWFDSNENWYRWPLHRAAMRGECSRIRELTVTTNRFDPNQKMSDWFDSEPLGWAASFGQLDAVRVLIECGADPTRPPNAAGNTPEKDAEREGHAHVVRFLKEFAYRKTHAHTQSAETEINAGLLFRGRADALGDPSESNFGFVMCPVFGHPDFDKGAYHAPIGCCCVRMNRAVGGVSDGEACLESFFSAIFLLPLILPLYALTCCYKPCGGPCWWGDAPCTEHRVTPQYARSWPCCVTRGAAVDRRRMTGGRMTVSTDAHARVARRDETNAQTTAGTAAPPRARMMRAAPRDAALPTV